MKPLLMLTLIAALGSGAALAEDGKKPPAKPDQKCERPLPPCKGDSAQCKLMHEGMDLRRAERMARQAYAKALAENKDQAARKTELLAAMDKLFAFEKAHVDDMAKAMAAREKDREDGKMPRDPAPRGHRGHGGPHHEGPDQDEGHEAPPQDFFGAPDMPPPPPEGDARQ